MTSQILDRLQELHPAVLLVVMLVLAAGEAALFLDLLVPGEVAMVVGGAVLAGEDGDAGRSAWIVGGMAAAAVGAVLGDSLSYWLGRTVGTRIIERWDFLQRHLGPQLERARDYFGRGGGPVIAVARFVGPLRAVVPFVAGSSGMDFRRFLQWDVPGRDRLGRADGRARRGVRRSDRAHHRPARLVVHDHHRRADRRLFRVPRDLEADAPEAA